MRRGIAIGLTLAVALVLASPAAADHHLIKIREYYPGTAAQADDGFLELQMYASGQNLVGGQEIHMYDSTETPPEPAVFELSMLLPTPANGDNQRTILIAGTSGPSNRDYPENLDAEYDPAGGGLCFVSTEGFGEIDCLEWGSGTSLVNAGTPIAPGGIPDASSANRSIAPGCSTLLEASDDSDDSATDFALAAPSPRNNATAPTETPCPPGGGGGTDTNPPQTTIDKGPKKRTEKRKAKFRFSSSEAGSSFQCKLDRKPFKPCDSPFRKKVKAGKKHKFRVRAIDAAGNVDPTPAKRKWKVRR